MSEDRKAWTTADEISFINASVKWFEKRKPIKQMVFNDLNAKDCLIRYVISAWQRKEWDDIDANKVRAHVHKLLGELT